MAEIKSAHPRADLRFWTDKKFVSKARSILVGANIENVKISTLVSGKMRRYHHLSVLQHLLWPKLIMLNTRDSFLVLVGFVQSFVKLVLWRPDVIFAKGGYVCLPVGIAAKLLGVPIVLHDSDAHPGLTNQMLSKWAKKIATGAPLEYYDYPVDRAAYIGIPISPEFHKFNTQEKTDARREWGIELSQPLLVITGGGLGATRINEAVVEALDSLNKVVSVVLISGNDQYDELRSLVPANNDRFQLHAFVSSGMAKLLGAADVVLARAGATTILELAALEMPTILVPNPKLTGGHQLKNAAVYKDAEAAIILDEDEMVGNPNAIVDTVKLILDNLVATNEMSSSFAKFSRPDAARQMAEMIVGAIRR